MTKSSIHKLGKLIQFIDKQPKLKDLVTKKKHIILPDIGHELYTKMFILFTLCNELLLDHYTTANWSNIQLLKSKYGIDVQVIGKHSVKASLVLSRGRFTFT